ncbi:hypothetical protein COO60DRAFT_1066818 [Scenedesmus sp. NREL 46B-D3]|nr:hypothetical protein COO60DRAFT_1066818 [Scenedesmus sp. NREL 46B-D3]
MRDLCVLLAAQTLLQGAAEHPFPAFVLQGYTAYRSAMLWLYTARKACCPVATSDTPSFAASLQTLRLYRSNHGTTAICVVI